MAKQRRGRRGSEAGGGGGMATLALLVLAAVAAGGFWLYRHTAAYQRTGAEPAGAVTTTGKGGGSLGGAASGVGAAGNSEQQRARIAAAVAEAEARFRRSGAPVHRDTWPQAPFGESEEVFETGAKSYVAHCASCHGQPGRAAVASSGAVALWDRHGTWGKADVPAGRIYLLIADGMQQVDPPETEDEPRGAMAGYRNVLSETEMWDLALLLRNAGQELPDPVMHLLRAKRP